MATGRRGREQLAHEPNTDLALTVPSLGASLRIAARALSLRCPSCGKGPVLVHWWKMRAACGSCGLDLERGEGDYFIGAMMFNLVLAELLFAVVFIGIIAWRWPDVPWETLQVAVPAGLLAAPAVLFPMSKLFWLGFDLALRPLAYTSPMADTNSFDVTTGVDLQEVDNAVNQAQKEVAQRYDFKGSKASIEFKRGEGKLLLVADDDFRMRALFDVLQGKLIKRGVPVKNLDIGDTTPAGGDTVRKDVGLKMALDGETAKKVAAAIKEAKLKKVQASIQGEQVRVSSPSKDELQAAIAVLRGKDFGVELKFGNFR